jgi:hypothetical protein
MCASFGRFGCSRKTGSLKSSRFGGAFLLAEFMFRWKQKTPYSQPGDWVFPSTDPNREGVGEVLTAGRQRLRSFA